MIGPRGTRFVALCVFHYIEEGNLRTTRRHRSRKPPIFIVNTSLPFSMSRHMHRCHTDGGSRRACIGCDREQGVDRPNEKACVVHQLVKHFSYSEPVAKELTRTILTTSHGHYLNAMALKKLEEHHPSSRDHCI